MNVTTYGFTILAAHGLGPAQYGAVASLMGLLLVLNVVALGLQTTGARRISTQPDHAARIGHQMLSVSNHAAWVLTLLCALGVPAMVAVLHLDSWWVAAMVPITVLPQTVMFGQAGVLQGQRRWLPLAWMYALNGASRLVLGGLGILLRPDALGAMLGVAVSAYVALVPGMVSLRGLHRAARADPARIRGGVISEVVRNSQALLAFLAVSNADIIVARSSLQEHAAGLYAGGLILVKAVLFLPQFVIVLAFPSMATGGERRDTRHALGLLVVGAAGAVAALGALVLPGLALLFVGGHQYAAIESRLWLFGVLGMMLSLMQLLIYDVVARQHHVAVILVWAALAAIAASVLVVDTLGQLLAWVTTVDSLLVAMLIVLSFPNLRGRSVRGLVPASPPADGDVERDGQLRG